MPVNFTLNQKPVALDAPPEKPLLWALREDAALTGTTTAIPPVAKQTVGTPTDAASRHTRG